jgi:hypothetical protein
MELRINATPNHWEYHVSFWLIDGAYKQQFRQRGQMSQVKYCKSDVLKEARRQLNFLLKQAYRQINFGILIYLLFEGKTIVKQRSLSPNWRID